MLAIQQQIEAFTSGTEAEYTFPAGLSVEERKLVKVTAEKLGLSSRSFGMGIERQIHIFKPVLTPGLEPSTNSETDTGSTVDSDSERQDPAISIKNTFVHFEMDNADPRIIQSMPAGAFTANIEVEKAEESTSAQRQKRRPSALSEILSFSEADETLSERVSAMVFPSTPNADNFDMYHNVMADKGAGQADAVPVAVGVGVGVVQWIVPSAATTNSVTVLPPARLASPASPAVRAAPALLQGPPQGPPQVPPQGLPHGPQGPLQGPPQEPPKVLPNGHQMQAQGSPPAYFMPGMHVVLQGLASQPDFNGLRGVVSAFDAECGRYNVMIEIGPNALKRLVKVKCQNLVPAQPMAQPHCCPTGQPPCCPHVQQPVVMGRPAKPSLVLDQMV